MKKSLIALAALSAFATAAQAQSSVSVYGTMDMGYISDKYKTVTAAGTQAQTLNTGVNGDGGLSTSVIGFRGTEDLGGGLKAGFHIEYDLVNVANGAGGKCDGAYDKTPGCTNAAAGNYADSLGARLSYLSVEDAKLGSLQVGRVFAPIHSVVTGFLATGGSNIAGQSYYSAGASGTSTEVAARPHQVFVNQAFKYATPTISGFKAELLVQEVTQDKETAATSDKVSQTGVSLSYVAGKFKLGAGQQVVKNKDSAQEDKLTVNAMGASYNFGVAELMVLNTSQKDRDITAGAVDGKKTFTDVGLRIPQGKVTYTVAYHDGKVETVNAANQWKQDGFQVGAQYALSKRTTAYGYYGEVTRKGSVGITNAEINKAEVKQYTVGLRHTF